MNATLADFNEGKEVIMTLKDERILDGDNVREDGDELENVNLVDVQVAQRNTALRQSKAGSAYTGLDDDEWNADGSINTNKKGILAKYDNLKDGQDVNEKATLLTLGSDELNADAAAAKEAERKADEIRGRIKENLNTVAFTKIAEKYTEDEMASFSKPKKKRKKVGKKKQSINWDEEEAKAIGEDHGSRASRNLAKEKARSDKIKKAQGALAYEQALGKASEDTNVKAEMAKHTVTETQYDSEEEDDLGAALAKTRQLKQTRTQHQSMEDMAEAIAREKAESLIVEENKMEEDSDSDAEEKLTMDATTEFCKMVEVEENENDSDDEDVEPAPLPSSMDVEATEAAGPQKEKGEDSDSEEEEGTDFTNDGLVSKGMGAALDFIRSRGALEDTHEGVTGRFNDKVFEGEYTEADAMNSMKNNTEDKKLNSFTLEYRDKFGRKMSQKEAFRQLSYGFHGKGPGKAKIEARQRKYAEEQRLRKQGQNGAIDQPITLQALKVQQKGTRQAHMVIGGGAGGLKRD